MRSRIFYCLILIILFSVSASQLALADEIVITEDGKKVFLKNDGTWEYMKEETKKKEGPYDFRNTTWGMSKIQIKRTEKGKIIKEDKNLLIYQGTVSEFDCFIVYIFAKGKLVRAKYVFTETHTNANDYISDFNTLKEILTKKYGKPVKDSHFWKGDLFRNCCQHRGLAVSMEELVYFAKRETSNTNINLALYGDNYEITLTIEYQSKKLKKLEEKEKEKKLLDKF